MLIFYTNLVKKLSLGKLNIIGITLFPFIFITKNKQGNETILRHEQIHFKQQVECLIIGFYLVYLLHFIWCLVKYRNFEKAYNNICFECEAYSNQRNKNYLDNRKRFSFIKYL